MPKGLRLDGVLLQQLIKRATMHTGEHRSSRYYPMGGRQHLDEVGALARGSGLLECLQHQTRTGVFLDLRVGDWRDRSKHNLRVVECLLEEEQIWGHQGVC